MVGVIARKPCTVSGIRRVRLGKVARNDGIVLFPAGATKVHPITSITRPARGRVRIEFGDAEHPQHVDAPASVLVSIIRRAR
ncbi:hypothetical protein SAMN05421805_104214 [Saccharopolyspora antimicrobica]|uniref:Uncharacterized protein n=1 Tax=Saccharopolyspora antimicrobica TaxID=455193 RepID=A0A1I4YP23_9PSEU|nr:hypothetical protein [Saccharopolyspora antimicrobica]RKT82743.1 hypothetical protein ATL45_0998 [Saccharopolyspora antimicrobica]SFN39350.1 hypothetical protein SAMN05421805_104214 [Saccharopolyspora antimicrobica]